MRRIIGLTGGIGSGKSTVSGYLRKQGHVVIDADQIAREIVEPGSAILEKLASSFGQEIIRGDGSLDRKALADIAFRHKEKHRLMENIMHGEIHRVMEERIDAASAVTVFLDIPLLFEAGVDKLFAMDEIWLVDAPEDVRIARVRKRDGATEEEIRERMSHQMASGEKRKRAHVIIENGGSEEELYHNLDKLIGGL